MNAELLQKLPYSIDKLSKCKTLDDIIAIYPEFSFYPEFKDDCGIPIGVALSLIVMLYSRDSYVSAEQSSAKINAAVHLGYESVGGKIKDLKVHGALMCDNKKFNAMMVRYIRMQYSSDFSELVIFNNAYYNQLSFLNDGKNENSEKTKDIIANIGQLKKQKQDIETRILNGNTTKENVNALYEHVEYTSLGIRPEDIAEKLRNNEDPIDIRPYGERYSFEKYGDRTKMFITDEK